MSALRGEFSGAKPRDYPKEEVAFRVFVCGGDTWTKEAIKLHLSAIKQQAWEKGRMLLMQGSNPAFDDLAGRWARGHGVENLKLKPDAWLGRSGLELSIERAFRDGKADVAVVFEGARELPLVEKLAKRYGVAVHFIGVDDLPRGLSNQ